MTKLEGQPGLYSLNSLQLELSLLEHREEMMHDIVFECMFLPSTCR